MKIVTPRHANPQLRKVLDWTAVANGEEPVIEEVLGWIWEELPTKYTTHALRLLMRWHALNGEPWPTCEADLPTTTTPEGT